MLMRLWCYVAAHGTKKPGWSLDSLGKPIDKAVLVEAAGTTEKKFDELMRECTRNGHVRKISYVKRGVIAFPAMSRRADTYTKRNVRTKFEVSSKFVRHNNTIQDNTKNNKTPLPPFTKGGRLTRAQLKAAELKRARVHGGCPHHPRCHTYAECIAQLALELKGRA